MALAPGTRLGPYEILSAIGAGGMGEVYRARDTKLGRDVALKVLPESFAADPERVARMHREAQVLAALNHSNIAAIHGFEDSGDVHALVLEFVDGETLAERIERGPIPLDEALPIVKQTAEALEAAHEQGIIHRDLKPANIKVRPDGTVKVLDFGLAKLAEATPTAAAAHAQSPLSMSPTITSPAMTGVGVLLGTAAYMSPEQAKGRPADKRSDIWAFGCVVFEMLTGRRAFAGDEVSDTLASVLKLDPSWNQLPADVPLGIRQTLRACLQKDPKQRIGDAQSLRLALNGAFETPISDESVVKTIAPGRRRTPWIAAVAMLIALTAIGFGAWMFMRTPPQPPAIMRFTVALPEGKILSTTGRSNIAISPDGSTIVYASDNRLFSRRLNDFESTPIRGTETPRVSAAEGISTPAFSPDGRSVAFFSPGDATLKRVDLDGGTPVTMCAVDPPFGITWDSSGLLIGQGAKGVARCAGIGSSLQQLVAVREGEEAHGPQLLPGTDLLVFTVSPTRDGADRWDRANIVVQSLSSGQRTTIIRGGSDAKYLASRHLVYGVGGTIFAVAFDPRDPTHVGEPVPVVQGVQRTITGTTGVVHFATSQNGTMVYVPGPASPTLTRERAIAIATREGSVERLAPPNGAYVSVRASRDGSFLAVGSDDSKEVNISIFPLDGTTAMRRLTFAGHNRFPVWSPDGARVAYQSDRDGDAAIFVQRADGTGIAERLTRPAKDEAHIPESWSPDGRTLLFTVRQGQTFSVWTLSLADRHVQPFGDIRSGQPIDPIFSPDGRWIAYRISTADPASAGVYVQPFPPTGARYEAPPVIADFHPVWTTDGNFLAYVPSAASGQLAVVRVTKGTSITFGVPVIGPAVVTGRATSSNPRVYDVLPDGRFVGLIIPGYESSTTTFFLGGNQIRAVVNWAEELKRLVPTK